jgi:hypothetical protein
MKDNSSYQPDRVCIPRTSSETKTGTFSLPSDMMDQAVMRLGWLGLIYAATINLVHWTRMYAMPANSLAAQGIPTLVYVALTIGTGLGLAICAATWSRKLAAQMLLDIGLVFEVVAALCTAILENSNPLITQGPIRGISGVAVWTVFFVLVIPTSFGKTTIATLTSAAMGPLGLLLFVAVNGTGLPDSKTWLSLFVPDFLCSFWAVVLSRFIYGMGRDLGKARRMGYYELIEPIGKGGMGEVWRAKHRMLARPAAIKLISAESAGIRSGSLTTTVIRRFEQEAQITATLQSQHTIQLYDFGITDDGAFYYVMEYLNGLDLKTLVEKFGPVPAERAVHFMVQVTDSLEEAHRAGMVHRDIKPANIFTSVHGVQYDFIKVLDFGLAKVAQKHEGITMSGSASGTPAFMAPEAALGEPVDARTDLYALGAVGYWLLTARLVFEAETPYATVIDHIRKAPVPPSKRTEIQIPEALERVIMMCLEKDPADRPASARELARMLRDVPLVAPWDEARAEHWWQLHEPQALGRMTVHAGEPVATEAL